MIPVDNTKPEQAAAEAIVDLATQSVVVEEEVGAVSSPLSATAILESDESGRGKLQMSEQQLHSLSTGDFIEINGDTYKVSLSAVCMTLLLNLRISYFGLVMTILEQLFLQIMHPISVWR